MFLNQPRGRTLPRFRVWFASIQRRWRIAATSLQLFMPTFGRWGTSLLGSRRRLIALRSEKRRYGVFWRSDVIAPRNAELEFHPEKTQIVYCKDEDRRRTYPHEKFDFLGYTFRPRRSKNRKGKFFINFCPAVSDKAVKAIRAEIRRWNLHLRSDKSIEDLSRMFNPIIRGWLQYYGRFYRSVYPPIRQLDEDPRDWRESSFVVDASKSPGTLSRR